MALPLGYAHAHAHPWHEHEDLFGEEDLQIGFKAGPQITSYTQYVLANANIVPQSRMRFVAGAAIKFIYDLPRFELGIQWNARGWVNTENTVNFAAFPFLVKFPLMIEKGLEFEIGPGIQPELTLFGADPHNYSMIGILGAAGLSIDYKQYVIDMELRYDYGLRSVSDAFSGSKNRDFQMVAGVLWHF
jgi:hypothetical protein